MVSGRLLRMLDTMTMLRAGRNNLVQDLAGFHRVSQRTVFRDLQDPKEAGVQHDNNAETGIYRMGKDLSLPPLNLNGMEAAILLLLARKAAIYMGLPFSESSKRAAAKLERKLPEEIRRFCRRYTQNASFGTRARPKSCFDEEIFRQILDAVQKKRVARMCYCPPSEGGSIMTELNPYHLFYDEPVWYVIGNSSFHQSVQSLSLRHIKRLEILDRSFDEKLDIGKYVGNVWSMLPRAAVCVVRLRFLPEVARDVADTLWHSTQRVSFQRDGSAMVEFRLNGFREITWWILSYADKVEVLEPEMLRRQIVAIAQKVLRINKWVPSAPHVGPQQKTAIQSSTGKKVSLGYILAYILGG